MIYQLGQSVSRLGPSLNCKVGHRTHVFRLPRVDLKAKLVGLSAELVGQKGDLLAFTTHRLSLSAY